MIEFDDLIAQARININDARNLLNSTDDILNTIIGTVIPPVIPVGTRPAFHVRRVDTTQTLSFNRWEKVIWQKILIDTGCFNLANSRYIPNVPGNYFVSSIIEIKNATGDVGLGRGIAIYKNGTMYESEFVLSTSPSILGHSVQVSSIIPMNGTTDYLEVCAYSDSKLSPTIEWDSWFCGFLV